MERVRRLSDNVILMGNGSFNYYLVGQDQAALLECGCTVGAGIFAEQYRRLENPPAVKYIVLLHSHFDHSCGLPLLQEMFPEAKVVGNAVCKKLLGKEKMVKLFFGIDGLVGQRYVEEGLVNEAPPTYDRDHLDVDMVVSDGEVLELGDGVSLKILETPGHSPCSISVWVEPDKVMMHSDATGVRLSPERIAPAYFGDYDSYLASIEKLMAYPAVACGGGHGDVIEGEAEVARYYEQARQCAAECHEDVAARLAAGEEADAIVEQLYAEGIGAGLEYYPKMVMTMSMKGMVK
ncbi:MAG: MBL fold metallo-hydrolase [Syntrophomonadaceae bacterium]|nr:MBL fold metallo-hydrolase [Syntrophomonadaceae bacterium]